jgi:hypothetical protein
LKENVKNRASQQVCHKQANNNAEQPVCHKQANNSAEQPVCHKQANNSAEQQVCRKASWNTQLAGPCHGWAIAADDHTFQLKTSRSSSSGHEITNNRQLRSEKTLPGPTNPGSCLVMLMAESGFGHESMSPSCLVSTVHAGGGVKVWGMLSPLIPTEQRFHTPKKFRLF